jgi:hypothetical protein
VVGETSIKERTLEIYFVRSTETHPFRDSDHG